MKIFLYFFLMFFAAIGQTYAQISNSVPLKRIGEHTIAPIMSSLDFEPVDEEKILNNAYRYDYYRRLVLKYFNQLRSLALKSGDRKIYEIILRSQEFDAELLVLILIDNERYEVFLKNNLNRNDFFNAVAAAWYEFRITTPNSKYDYNIGEIIDNFTKIGKLTIITKPVGATITVNNIENVDPSDTSFWLKEGKYLVLIEKIGYKKIEEEVLIVPQKEKSLDRQLMPIR